MEYLKDGKISAGHARALLTLENEELMTELADEIVAKDLSVRQVEKSARKTDSSKEEKPEKKPSFYSMVELALSESLGRKSAFQRARASKAVFFRLNSIRTKNLQSFQTNLNNIT